MNNICLSLIVPVYNEEKRLGTSLSHVFEYLRKSFERWEIIYSDDGSTDGTAAKLQEIQAGCDRFRIVASAKNRGKGAAVRRGLEMASGNVLLFSDADFSTPIEDTDKLLSRILEGYDFAIGSRALPDSNVELHQSVARESIGKIGNHIIRTLLPLEFKDTQCGFKMLRKTAADIILPRMQIERFAFDIEMLLIAQHHNLKIIEVPVTWRNVLESKVHPVKNSLEVLADLFNIRYRMATGYYS